MEENTARHVMIRCLIFMIVLNFKNGEIKINTAKSGAAF
tara:strand:- start:13974 stop:14090 length:117 start_codon:yes stop_codon:yes gene_type:complete